MDPLPYVQRLLRRLAGPDPVLTQRLLVALRDVRCAESNRAQEVEKQRELRRELGAARNEIHNLREKLGNALNVEPPASEACTKVRLRDRVEAEAFAARLAKDSGREPEDFRSYPCKLCPRQPVGGNRFLHIANVDPRERTERGTREARKAGWEKVNREKSRSGTALGRRVGPDVAARLRNIT